MGKKSGTVVSFAAATMICTLAINLLSSCTFEKGPVKVEITQTDTGFVLLRGGDPYYVKGAVVVDRYYETALKAGANSLRIHGITRKLLDRADSLGMSVMFGLPVKPERNGMDYNDTAAVRRQHERVMARVREFRDHPAVLVWYLGNELDYVTPYRDPNWKVYDALSELAKDIRKEDPLHPVMTVIGTGKPYKLGILMEKVPELDLLGINSYADIGKVRQWLESYGWDKPYMITEWGVSGPWQVEHTEWGRPIEETGGKKMELRINRYQKHIWANRDICLGSYSFFWYHFQRTTHTWMGMFDTGGRHSGSVDAMQYAWTGEWPENRTPVVDSLYIGGLTAYDHVYLMPGKKYTARAVATEPDGELMTCNWELLPEPEEYGAYAGQGEVKQPQVPNTLPEDSDRPEIIFRAPGKTGPYRLYINVYDGNGHYSEANVPFYVTNDPEKGVMIEADPGEW